MVYEFQKILTSIVIVILVVFGISKISNFIYSTEKNVVAYKVEAEDKSSDTVIFCSIRHNRAR